MFCLDYYRMKLEFEDYGNNLSEVITQRVDKFTEEEIWLIFEDLIDFVYDMDSIGYHCGDIQP